MTREQDNKFWVIFFFIVVCLGLPGCSKSPEVTNIGNQISFKSSKFHAVMEKGAEFSDTYVVFAKSRIQNAFFDERMSLMPLEKAVKLSQRYGDFMRCSNEGSTQAKELIMNYRVIAGNTEVRNKIDKKAKSVFPIGSQKYPVIKLKGNELKLQILAMIIKGKERSVDENQNLGHGIFVFVKDVEIFD